jgi:hypothetical protein
MTVTRVGTVIAIYTARASARFRIRDGHNARGAGSDQSGKIRVPHPPLPVRLGDLMALDILRRIPCLVHVSLNHSVHLLNWQRRGRVVVAKSLGGYCNFSLAESKPVVRSRRLRESAPSARM